MVKKICVRCSAAEKCDDLTCIYNEWFELPDGFVNLFTICKKTNTWRELVTKKPKCESIW